MHLLRCNKWMSQIDPKTPFSSFYLSRFPSGLPRIITAWIYIIGDEAVRNPDPFHRPMFIFLLKGEDARCPLGPFPKESLCPRDPSNQTSCCSYMMPSLPQLPGDVSWEDMRYGAGKGGDSGRRRGNYIFARVVHQWDEETNCIFRRATRVNTVSSTHSSSFSCALCTRWLRSEVLSKRGVFYDPLPQPRSPPSTLPIRSHRGKDGKSKAGVKSGPEKASLLIP